MKDLYGELVSLSGELAIHYADVFFDFLKRTEKTTVLGVLCVLLLVKLDVLKEPTPKSQRDCGLLSPSFS